MQNSRSIVTSASNKFFPSVLNLVGSIKVNYPTHPHIYIWDLGLSPTFRNELAGIKDVTVVPMPHFTTFWRKCYTWKTYIFANPFTERTLYLDAGTEVLRPLDELYDKISSQGYLAVSQALPCEKIIPKEYYSLFGLPASFGEKDVITAGIFGFDHSQTHIRSLLSGLHDASLTGLCLGYSKNDLWKNKYPNKNFFIRNCDIFRHDTTLLTIFLHKYLEKLNIEPLEFFDIHKGGQNQYIWNVRLLYSKLEYLGIKKINSVSRASAVANRIYLAIFLLLKGFNKIIKRNKY